MIRIEEHGVEGALAGLQQINPSRIQTKLRSAIRASLRSAKAELKSRIQARYTAKNPMSLGKTKTTASALNGKLTVSGRRNQLKKFQIDPRSRPKKMPAGGVHASIVRGGGGNLRHAFLQRSGGVYERTTSARFPIRQLKTINLPGMAKAVANHVQAKIKSRLASELNNL